MRILHTADWHLGRTIRGRSRATEFEAVLGEIVEIATAERVDVLLVCGDIWDTAAPSPESDRLLFETLRQLIGAGVQVVLLAGNHDSPRKLEAVGRLSDLLGVYTQHAVRPSDEGGVLTLRAGDEVARIAAVPWVTEGRLVDAAELLGLAPEEAHASYAEGVGRVYRALCSGFMPDAVNLLAGHLFVDGARLAAVDRVLLQWRIRPDRTSVRHEAYTLEAFRRCKVHYLLDTLARDRDGLVVWGAGPIGKAFAREVQEQGGTVRAFVDLNPRKIGQCIHGAPVIPPSEIDRYRDGFSVAAVGQEGARWQIRAKLASAGWKEVIDFVAVA